MPTDSGSGSEPYDDVAATSDYADNIAQLRELGVFDGTECGDENFCPDDPIDQQTFSVWLNRVLGRGDGGEVPGGCETGSDDSCGGDPVTRSDMAAMFVRAFDLGPAKNPGGFVDVDTDSPVYENIASLRATTIDTDCSRPSRFCPDDAVTRRQMANLLARAIDWQKA